MYGCMGGTDQLDQSIAAYRPCIRNRKWYWPIFVYCVQVSLYNSWILYRQLEKEWIFLEHLHVIATSYLKNHSYQKRIVKSTETRFVNSRVAKRVTQEVRFDGVNHFLGLAEKKARCALCVSTTKHTCTKSGVKLHELCFSAFHGLTE